MGFDLEEEFEDISEIRLRRVLLSLHGILELQLILRKKEDELTGHKRQKGLSRLENNCELKGATSDVT